MSLCTRQPFVPTLFCLCSDYSTGLKGPLYLPLLPLQITAHDKSDVQWHKSHLSIFATLQSVRSSEIPTQGDAATALASSTSVDPDVLFENPAVPVPSALV